MRCAKKILFGSKIFFFVYYYYRQFTQVESVGSQVARPSGTPPPSRMQRISINCCCETPSRVRRRPSPCAVLPYSPTHPTPTLPPGLRSHPAAPVPGSHSSAQPKAPTFPPASFLSGGFPRIRLWVPWVDAPPPSPGRDGGFPPGLPAPEVARFAGSDLLIRFEEQVSRVGCCASAGVCARVVRFGDVWGFSFPNLCLRVRAACSRPDLHFSGGDWRGGDDVLCGGSDLLLGCRSGRYTHGVIFCLLFCFVLHL